MINTNSFLLLKNSPKHFTFCKAAMILGLYLTIIVAFRIYDNSIIAMLTENWNKSAKIKMFCLCFLLRPKLYLHHSPPPKHTHTHTRTGIHTHTHTHARTHTRTHRHTHTGTHRALFLASGALPGTYDCCAYLSRGAVVCWCCREAVRPRL